MLLEWKAELRPCAISFSSNYKACSLTSPVDDVHTLIYELKSGTKISRPEVPKNLGFCKGSLLSNSEIWGLLVQFKGVRGRNCSKTINDGFLYSGCCSPNQVCSCHKAFVLNMVASSRTFSL